MFKKKVIVDLYTHRSEVFEHSKLYRSGVNKPSWWKSLPFFDDRVHDKSNMKSCSGFNDLYSKGYTLPMWSDLLLEFGEIGNQGWSYRYADQTSNAEVHSDSTRTGWLSDNEYQHFKLNTPWSAVCSEDVEFLYTNAAYEHLNPLDWMVPNGVLEFKNQRVIAINLFAKRGAEPKDLFFELGSPMAMIIPMTDRQVEFKHHLVSVDEWMQITNAKAKRLTFQRNYYKLKKCPIH